MAPSIWQILIVLLIVLLIFGTKKLRNVGEDLGSAVRGFKEGMKTDEEKAAAKAESKAEASKQLAEGQTIEGEVKDKTRT